MARQVAPECESRGDAQIFVRAAGHDEHAPEQVGSFNALQRGHRMPGAARPHLVHVEMACVDGQAAA